MKKLVIVLTGALLLAGGAAAWFFLQRQPAYKPTQSMKAIPVDASLIIESNNLSSMMDLFQGEQDVMEELVKAEGIAPFANQIKQLNGWINKHDSIEKGLASQKAIISLHVKGNTKVRPLLATNIPDRKTAKELIDGLKRATTGHYTIDSRIYNDIRVFKMQPGQGNFPKLVFARHQGIFLLSTSSILLEEALRQLDTSVSALIANDFKEVSATAGKNTDANVYVNYRRFPYLIELLLNQYSREFISSLKNFAGWSELDVKVRNKAVLMNGFVHPANRNSNYMQVFKKLEPVDITLPEYLPGNTSSFFMLGINDFMQYRKSYRSYLESRGNNHKYEHHINKVQRELKVDIEAVFHQITDEEMAAVFTDVDKPVNSSNAYAFFKINSKKEALKRLMPMLKNYAEFKAIALDELISEHELNEEEKFLIYRMPVMKIASKLFGMIFDRIPTNFFTFIDDVLVMARSKEALVEYRHMMEQEKVLTAGQQYDDFAHALSSSANFYMYANVSRSVDLASYFMNKNTLGYFNNNLGVFSKFEAVGLQFASNQDMIYSNIYLKFNPETRLFQNLVWEKELDAPVTSKPALVRNHYTGENEIFVQDEDNRAYLLDKTGKVLWKKRLDEPILSEIHQIDYFGNDKLQMLFNTENRMHLLDRKGQYVENYPLELQASATNGLSVFDYKGGADYRIALATVDNRVLLLDKYGEPVEGWQFGETESEVTAPVQHIRISNKDFICFSDQDRVYLLHRRGTVRVKPGEQFAKSPENIFYTEFGSNPDKARFVTTSKSGTVKKIGLDGKVTTVKTGGYGEEHHFIYEDLNNSGQAEYIFMQGKKLKVFNKNMKEVFSYALDSKSSVAPAIYEFAVNNKKIGLVEETAHELILLNKDGSMFGNFPLKGQSPFSIGFLSAKASSFKLVAGSEKGLLLYKLQ